MRDLSERFETYNRTIELMKDLCGGWATQRFTLKTMWEYVHKYYDKENILCTKQFILARGSDIAIAAHMDTVFPEKQFTHENLKQIYIDKDWWTMWSPQGLGADDRAGLAAIILLLEAGYRPSLILTTDEEAGGLGAESIVKSKSHLFLGNLKSIIELDRRGSNDCVFYECGNEKFMKYIESFGFKMNYGTFTDISILAPAMDVAAVNLSIGYENEHTLGEYLNIPHFYESVVRVSRILDKTESSKWYKYEGIIPHFAYSNIMPSYKNYNRKK